MIVKKAIGYILKNTAGVTAFVSQRTYDMVAPQNATLPYVVFSIAPGGVNPYDTKTGAADLDQIRIQVDAFAAKNDDAALLNNAIRAALDRYPHGSVNGVTLDGIQYVTTADFVEPDINTDGSTVIFHYASDYYVRVKY